MSTLVFIKMIKFKKGGSLGDVLQKYWIIITQYISTNNAL
jgi:hypothetical protein